MFCECEEQQGGQCGQSEEEGKNIGNEVIEGQCPVL